MPKTETISSGDRLPSKSQKAAGHYVQSVQVGGRRASKRVGRDEESIHVWRAVAVPGVRAVAGRTVEEEEATGPADIESQRGPKAQEGRKSHSKVGKGTVNFFLPSEFMNVPCRDRISTFVASAVPLIRKISIHFYVGTQYFTSCKPSVIEELKGP